MYVCVNWFLALFLVCVSVLGMTYEFRVLMFTAVQAGEEAIKVVKIDGTGKRLLQCAWV